MYLKLNEFETGRVARVNISKVIYYKTIRVRKPSSNGADSEMTEATGIRFENDPIMLVVTESAEQIDLLLREGYHYIKES